MTSYKSSFMRTMNDRMFIHQITNGTHLDTLMKRHNISGYIGFDCTADSLHVGSLVQIMMLRHLQKCGHRPIVLMGGGTTKVGDPSGKDDARRLLSDHDIEINKAGIRKIFEKYLHFGHGPNDAVMCDNNDWLSDLQYITFLRDYGQHFSVNRMLSFESVKIRLDREQPLSFLEFNYMILQAYDFLELNRRYNCQLQIGGSDQWGNIVNGVELARRAEQKSVYGLTSPLVTTSSGAKMGKTAEGAIWLNAEKLSPYEFWQFWRNTEDLDVGRFLKLFTDLPLDEIDRLEKLQGGELNEAKKILADEATKLCHGEELASFAASTARRTFEQGVIDEGLPTLELPRIELERGLWIIEAFRRGNLVSSNSEARRLINNGGARINDISISDEEMMLGVDDLNAAGLIKLSSGKKRHIIIRIQ